MLPSKEEYQKNLEEWWEWSDPLYQCPNCKEGAMRKNLTYVLTSYPPKHTYKCDKCAYEEVW